MAAKIGKSVHFKLVLLGDAAVGKSCLVLRFCKNTFSDVLESTIGAAFLTQNVTLNDLVVHFEIWDTAGQERFHSLAPMYYRGAAAAIVVYDITNKESFNRAGEWVKELQRQASPNIVIALAANKVDLESSRVVNKSDGAAFAEENGLFFLETSAKTAANVNDLFVALAKRLPKTAQASAASSHRGSNIMVHNVGQSAGPQMVDGGGERGKESAARVDRAGWLISIPIWWLYTLLCFRVPPLDDLAPGVRLFVMKEVHGEFKTGRGVNLNTLSFQLDDDDAKPKGIVLFFHGVQGQFLNKDPITQEGARLGTTHTATAFIDHGYEFHGYDMFGHGSSGGLRHYVDDWRKFVCDAELFVTSVLERAEHPDVPFFLSGESFGGAIALHLGLRYQRLLEEKSGVDPLYRTLVERFHGVLLVAPAIVGDLPPAPVVMLLRYCCAPVFPTWTPFFMPHPVSAERCWRDPKVCAYMKEELKGGDPFRLGTAVSMLGITEKIREDISEITYPFAVAHGSDDMAVKIEGSYLLYNSAKTPRLDADEPDSLTSDRAMRVIEGAYHDVYCDPQADEMLQWFINWMDAHVAALPKLDGELPSEVSEVSL